MYMYTGAKVVLKIGTKVVLIIGSRVVLIHMYMNMYHTHHDLVRLIGANKEGLLWYSMVHSALPF